MKGHNYGLCRKCHKFHKHPKGNKGKRAWNKGLTKETDKRVEKNTKNQKENMKGNHYALGKKWTIISREKLSHSCLGRIPWNKGLTKETDERVMKQSINNSKGHRKLYAEHPEKHPNYILARLPFPRVSKPQLMVFQFIKERYKNAELNFPVVTKTGTKYIDVAIPNKHLAIEYDGKYWHDDKTDSLRDEALFCSGWRVIHIKEGKKDIDRKFLEKFLGKYL